MAIDVGNAACPDSLGWGWARTVAHVDIRSALEGTTEPAATETARLLASALRRVEQTVRADDRICPFGVSRIAIAFGPDAEAVTPKTLGGRLARAVVFGLASDREAIPPFSIPGATAGPKKVVPPYGAMGDHLAGVATRSSAVVTIDRLVSHRTHGLTTVMPGVVATGADRCPSLTHSGALLLRHRTVVRYPTGRRAGFGARHDDGLPGSRPAGTAGTLLVVDPTSSTPGNPGLAAQAVLSTSERLGFKAEAVAPAIDGVFDLTVGTAGLDLVVLVVGSEPASDFPLWSSSTWCVPAQLAAGYASLGIDVLAVSVGAGAGALTGCFEQGATILFDLDGLPAELYARRRNHRPSGALVSEGGIGRLPPRFEALLQLTASERRVLFYLSTGKSAQEVADNLVVALTTVRSHIRSVLRKLGVRSQLAAVVCANSRDLGHIQPAGSADRAPVASEIPRRRTG